MKLTWRKSSYSNGDTYADCVEVAWHKSNGTTSSSVSSGACADAARLPLPRPPIPPSPDLCSSGLCSSGLLSAVRDSKNPAATLTFPTTPWHAFLTSLSDQRS